jgi:uncharacterized protein (UPF0335 family)
MSLSEQLMGEPKEPAFELLEILSMTKLDEKERVKIFQDMDSSYKERFEVLKVRQKDLFDELEELNTERIINGVSTELIEKVAFLKQKEADLNQEHSKLLAEYNAQLQKTINIAHIRQN